ncbi:MAG TPA: hypothetical protein EYN91_22315 [Candidatus Melainabacteria bacterium]|nr:hypothetical protein [Candidatus Melainabacteria bacterium]HIN63492.1 hypothetical protein [Candidatus Obscuribacterales bacterium]
MLIERLFFTASFLLLAGNLSKLLELEHGQLYLNLVIVKEQFFILFVLVFFIGRMDETEYRSKVLFWLKFFLYIFAAGGIARYRNKVGGSVTDQGSGSSFHP